MTRAPLAAALTALLALSACATAGTPERPAGAVTVVGFTETSHEPGGAAYDSQVLIHLAQHGGTLRAMRFRTRIGDRIVEERLWRAEFPDTVSVRVWPECRQADEPMPPPRPESVEQVLTEYFGPRQPPAAPTPGAPVTWTDTLDAGLVRTVTDDGTGYPGGRTVSIGADGDAGTTISGGSVTEAIAMPDWSTCPVHSANPRAHAAIATEG